MKNFYCSLASSSKGNCSILSLNGTVILIDIGISFTALSKGLTKLSLSLHDIDMLLITHEHTDHIKGLSTLLSKCSIKTYASFGTAHEIYAKHDNLRGKITEFIPGDDLSFSEVLINTYATPHDSIQSVAYKFCTHNFYIGFMTDLGYISDSLCRAFTGCNMMVLESNYDDEMLKNGPYPYYLKKRISGNTGHLSNEQCGLFASFLAENGTDIFVLSHLSENNNTPKKSLETVMFYLDKTSQKYVLDENIFVSPVKDTVIPIILPIKTKLYA